MLLTNIFSGIMEFCSVALVIVLTGYIIRECLPPGPKTKIANPVSSGDNKDKETLTDC